MNVIQMVILPKNKFTIANYAISGSVKYISNQSFLTFVDWETVFDVQGNPEIKALFYSQYGREDGHADFVYLRKTIEKLNLKKVYMTNSSNKR